MIVPIVLFKLYLMHLFCKTFVNGFQYRTLGFELRRYGWGSLSGSASSHVQLLSPDSIDHTQVLKLLRYFKSLDVNLSFNLVIFSSLLLSEEIEIMKCALCLFFKLSHFHPKGFFWGHQCSWTLIPAISMQSDDSNRK